MGKSGSFCRTSLGISVQIPKWVHGTLCDGSAWGCQGERSLELLAGSSRKLVSQDSGRDTVGTSEDYTRCWAKAPVRILALSHQCRDWWYFFFPDHENQEHLQNNANSQGLAGCLLFCFLRGCSSLFLIHLLITQMHKSPLGSLKLHLSWKILKIIFSDLQITEKGADECSDLSWLGSECWKLSPLLCCSDAWRKIFAI